MALTPEEKRKRHADYMREYNRRTGYQKAAYHDPEKLEKQRAKWRAAHARWRAKNADKHRAMSKRYADANKEVVLAKARAYHKRSRVQRQKQKRIYIANNLDAHRERARSYMARRLESDENFRLLQRLRARVRSALERRKVIKTNRTRDLIGCDTDFLRGYLEARFLPSMTWKNQGKVWHIDHIIPCAEFDLRDVGQQKMAFHYSNLRPLWAAENIAKGSKRPPTHQAELI